MSNIIKTIDYLKANPTNRFIRVINSATNYKIGKTDIYIDDIPGEDLSSYIKTSLGPITVPTFVYVEVRAKEGSNSRKKDGYSLEIQPDIVPVPQLPVVQNPAPVHYPVPQPVEQTNFFQSGGLGQTLGLGFPQIMEMQRKSDRLTDREEQLADLKEDLKELKHEHKQLEIENRELKTQKSMAEAQKDMAVMMVKMENKSFFDSPAFEKVMDQAPQMLAAIASMKSGGVATGALGSSLTETQSGFIEYVTENLTDAQLNYLGAVAGNINNEMFMTELQQLITRYASV